MSANLKQLEKFGLSEKEAQTYLSLLELGESSVNEIAKESGVNRSTAYVVLEALEKKRLVVASQNEAVQRFKAVEPEILSQMANDKLREFQNIAESMKHLVPDLKSIHKENKHRPKVKVYEGLEGLREVYYVISGIKDGELLVYADGQGILQLFPEYVAKHHERALNGIPMRAINPDLPTYESMVKNNAPKGDQFILIPKEKFSFESDMGIYENSVSFISRKELFAVEIESKHIANAMRSHYEFVWESALAIGKHIVGTQHLK